MIYLQSVRVEGGDKNVFPFSLDLYKNGMELDFQNDVTVFAGENGAGKSTLLENLAIACGYPRQGGVYGNTVRKTYGTNYYGEEIEIQPDNLELAQHMTLSWKTRARRGYFLRAEYMSDTIATHRGAKKYLSCSHGEGIIEIVRDFFRDGLFILDEPETALSPTSQIALLGIIAENVKKYDAQYIIVTHSPILIAIPQSTFMWIGGGKFTEMPYSHAPHFQIMRAFCENPERIIDEML
jgi:predicted ATPase